MSWDDSCWYPEYPFIIFVENIRIYIIAKASTVSYDCLGRQVEAEVGWVEFAELLLVLKSAEGEFADLLVFEVFFASAVPLRVVRVGILGVALVAVVGRN